MPTKQELIEKARSLATREEKQRDRAKVRLEAKREIQKTLKDELRALELEWQSRKESVDRLTDALDSLEELTDVEE
jgi:hypothetical protein